MQKNYKTILSSTIILTVIWILITIYFFYFIDETGYTWSRGEIGDFIGGGLGGIALIIIIFTSYLQGQDLREAGIFRSFQALSPEAENVSVRIISKIIKAKLVNDSEKDFDLMLKKFRDGDRSVFLRAMKEDIYSNIIHASKNNKDIEDACKRFENLVNVVYKNIEMAPNKAVLGFILYRIEIPRIVNKIAIERAILTDILPVGNGLFCVRFIIASVSFSII